MERKIEDIHQRIYKFVIKVLNQVKKLPYTPENKVIRHQIAKSVTSMGANDQEADGSTSAKDFINKYSIVRKESKETDYWLRIIKDINPDLEKTSVELLKELDEIIKIISKIIYNTKSKIK